VRIESRARGEQQLGGHRVLGIGAELCEDRPPALGNRRVGRRKVAAAGGVGRVGDRRGPRPEVVGSRESLRNQPRAHDDTVARDELAGGAPGRGELGEAEQRRRIEDGAEQKGEAGDPEGAEDFPEHCSLSA